MVDGEIIFSNMENHLISSFQPVDVQMSIENITVFSDSKGPDPAGQTETTITHQQRRITFHWMGMVFGDLLLTKITFHSNNIRISRQEKVIKVLYFFNRLVGVKFGKKLRARRSC